ncbi:MAG: hypothetical protein IT313_01205 [Anaerolineales bacterium]|nr:hypothetical protein [Anaerolineales bacterium]
MKLKIKRLQIQSIRFGVLSAGIGCAAFVLVEQLRLIVSFGKRSFDSLVDIEVAVLIFIFGTVLSFLPTILSSSVLAIILYRETLKGDLSIPKALGWGALAGIVSGIAVSIAGFVLTLGKGSDAVYLLHAVEVIGIASASGGWTGCRLARYISKEREDLNPKPVF